MPPVHHILKPYICSNMADGNIKIRMIWDLHSDEGGVTMNTWTTHVNFRMHRSGTKTIIPVAAIRNGKMADAVHRI